MTKRRYEPGEYPEYDHRYNLEMSRSVIFHPERAPVSHAHIPDWVRNKSGIEKLIKEWKPKLSHAQTKLDDIGLEFDDMKKRAINTGRRAPEEMPADLSKEHLIAQALHDVTAEEIAHLEEILSEFVEEERKQDDGMLLKYGPVGMSKIKNGQVCEVDGQKVGKHESGLFMIDDKRSKYHGMLVCDYIENIVKPWVKSQGRHSHQVKQYSLRKAKAAEAGQPFSEKFPAPPEWPERR